MPSLKLYGHRWLLNGDDLPPISLLIVLSRLTQLLFLFPIFTNLFHPSSYRTTSKLPTSQTACRDDTELQLVSKFYVGFTTLLFLLSLLLEALIIKAANLGNPTNGHLTRTTLNSLLKLKGNIFYPVLILITILGFLCVPACLSSSSSSVNPILVGHFFGSYGWVTLPLLLASQALEIVLVGCILRTIVGRREDSYKNRPDHYQSSRQRFGTTTVEDKWERKCKFFCRCSNAATCFLFGGNDLRSSSKKNGTGGVGPGGEFAMVARLLADYFEDGGHLDIVPSDVAAGIVMLRRLQKKEEFARSFERLEGLEGLEGGLEDPPLSPTPKNTPTTTHPLPTHWYRVAHRTPLSPESDSDRLILDEGARFSRHALAIYTWMLYVFMHPVKGFCDIGCISCCVLGRDKSRNRNRSRSRHRLKSHYEDEEGEGEGEGECCVSCCNFAKTTLPPHGETRPFTDSVGSENSPPTLNPNPNTNIDTPSSPPYPEPHPEPHQGGPQFAHDTCLRGHASALLAQASLDESEIVYCHFRNSILESPYSIVLDRKFRVVVLSIRGTLSLEDCLTDVLTELSPLDEVGEEYGFDGEGEFAHHGMLRTAQWILQELKEHGMLKRAMEMEGSEGYGLRITGHSLGAGVATLLSLMLRREYPQLKCLAYSPPGGLVTIKTATYCKSFLTSYVLNNDMVIRLSVDSMETLRNDTLDLISRMKVNKMKILKSISKVKHNFSEDELLFDSQHIPRSKFVEQVEKYKEVQEQIKRKRGRIGVKLFPPGRIVHFVQSDQQQLFCPNVRKFIPFCRAREKIYVPTWAECEDFQKIMVSSSMALDHFPNNICSSLEAVAKSWHIDITPGSKEELGGQNINDFFVDNTIV